MRPKHYPRHHVVATFPRRFVPTAAMLAAKDCSRTETHRSRDGEDNKFDNNLIGLRKQTQSREETNQTSLTTGNNRKQKIRRGISDRGCLSVDGKHSKKNWPFGNAVLRGLTPIPASTGTLLADGTSTHPQDRNERLVYVARPPSLRFQVFGTPACDAAPRSILTLRNKTRLTPDSTLLFSPGITAVHT